jgi:hypothetical protein
MTRGFSQVWEDSKERDKLQYEMVKDGIEAWGFLSIDLYRKEKSQEELVGVSPCRDEEAIESLLNCSLYPPQYS